MCAKATTVDLRAAYKDILDEIDDGIFVFDANSRLIYLNKKAIEGSGFTKDELQGATLSDLIAMQFRDVFVTKAVLKSRKRETIIQHSRDGKAFVTTGIPFFEDGKLVYVVSCERDYNGLIKAEEEASGVYDVFVQEMGDRQGSSFFSEGVVCASEKMRNVVKLAKKVAETDSTVMVLGESGVGKEIIVKYIQSNSKQSDAPFMKINCGAIPENLLESELFGYEEGAFTGATKGGKKGIFESADGGTLFLDEIGEMPFHLQAKLLRAIQERTIIRVGSTREIAVNVRIIAATNKDLKEMVQNGSFREDLYYRLSVIEITVPPLRDRKEDIVSFAKLFIEKNNKKYGREKRLSPKAFSFLIRQSWPGNVRQLENLMENLVVTSDSDEISVKDLYDRFYKEEANEEVVQHFSGSLSDRVDAYEKKLLQEAFEAEKDTLRLANRLGTTRSTLNRKLKKYGIR